MWLGRKLGYRGFAVVFQFSAVPKQGRQVGTAGVVVVVVVVRGGRYRDQHSLLSYMEKKADTLQFCFLSHSVCVYMMYTTITTSFATCFLNIKISQVPKLLVDHCLLSPCGIQVYHVYVMIYIYTEKLMMFWLKIMGAWWIHVVYVSTFWRMWYSLILRIWSYM